METKAIENVSTSVNGQDVTTPLSNRRGVGGEAVIRLTGINKIYRTDEVETQALENVRRD